MMVMIALRVVYRELGSSGMGLGYDQINNSLAVEFDTFFNAETLDQCVILALSITFFIIIFFLLYSGGNKFAHIWSCCNAHLFYIM